MSIKCNLCVREQANYCKKCFNFLVQQEIKKIFEHIEKLGNPEHLCNCEKFCDCYVNLKNKFIKSLEGK